MHNDDSPPILTKENTTKGPIDRTFAIENSNGTGKRPSNSNHQHPDYKSYKSKCDKGVKGHRCSWFQENSFLITPKPRLPRKTKKIEIIEALPRICKYNGRKQWQHLQMSRVFAMKVLCIREWWNAMINKSRRSGRENESEKGSSRYAKTVILVASAAKPSAAERRPRKPTAATDYHIVLLHGQGWCSLSRSSLVEVCGGDTPTSLFSDDGVKVIWHINKIFFTENMQYYIKNITQ